MAKIDLSTFANLLSDYYTTLGNKLPDINISSNTTLGYAIDKLKQDQLINETEGEQAIRNVIDDFQKALSDEFLLQNGLNDLDQMSEMFEQRIRQAFTDLREVRREVDELKQQIDNRIDRMISQDPFLSKHYHEQNENIEPEFSKIDWSPIGSIGAESQIVMDLNSTISEFQGVSETKPTVLSRLSRQLTQRLDKEYEQVEITKETEERIVNNLVEKTGNPTDIVRKYVKQLVNYKDGVRRLSTMTEKLGSIRNGMDTCTLFLSTIEDYNNLLSATDDLDLSSKTENSIKSNLSIISQIVQSMAYYLIHMRRQMFAESIVLPNGQMNPDNEEDYFDNGGTNMKLQHYIKLFHGEEGLRNSMHGVTVKNARESEELVEEKMKKNEANMATRAKSDYRKIVRESFVAIMNSYIAEGTDPEIPRNLQIPIEHTNSLVEFGGDSVINSTPMEDAIYNILMKAYYQREFVSVLYKRIGKTSLEAIGKQKEIGQNDVQLIETKVVTEMISEFVIHSGLAELHGV